MNIQADKICIQGGSLLDPASGQNQLCNIILKDGKIDSIEPMDVINPADCAQTIDARGKIVAPGLVDVHVHFRDPGLTHKEDLFSGAAAAARGGFTTVVCMANTKPVLDNPATLRTWLAKAQQAPIHLKTVASVSKGFAGKELADLPLLFALGAVGFSDDGIPLTDRAFVEKAMHAVKELDVPISLHEEDPAFIGCAGIHDGAIARKLNLRGASSKSESSIVARDCMLALETGAKVHIQHISCAESVAVIRDAKKSGAQISAEVTPQHFSLTQEALLTQGTLAKVNPPLRTEADRFAVIQGLCDGTIDMIATDHAPHTAEEKAQPFEKAPSGMIGLETALALGIVHLVQTGYLTLSQLLYKMTVAPAQLYHLPAGRIAPGQPADIVIFDPQAHWVVSDFASRSSNSPFIGQKLCGKIQYTISSGKVVYSDREEING